MTAGWRRREAAAEGLRTLMASGAIGVALVALTATGLGLPAALEARQVSALVTDEADWVASGGTVLVASIDGASLQARACENVSMVDGVQAAFGITRHAGATGTASAPGARVAVASVTSGIYSFLNAAPGGALISPRVEEDIGVGSSLILLTPAKTPADESDPAGAPISDAPVGTVAISDVVPTDVLGDEYAYIALVPQPAAGDVDRCYVRTSPADLGTVRAALPALLAVGGETVIVADRFVGGRFSRSFSQEYATRTTQLMPYLGGVAVALMWLIITWIRRSEDGLYKTMGASLTDRAAMRGTEWLAILALGAVSAWSGVLLVLALTDDATAVALRAAASSIAIAAASSLLVSTLWFALPRRDTLADLKDR